MSKEGIAAELSNIEEAVGRIRGMLQAPLSRSASTVSSASGSSSNSNRFGATGTSGGPALNGSPATGMVGGPALNGSPGTGTVGGPGRNNNGVASVNWNNEFGNMFELTNKEVEKYMANQKRNKTKRNKLNNATRKALNNQDRLMVKAGLAPPPRNNTKKAAPMKGITYVNMPPTPPTINRKLYDSMFDSVTPNYRPEKRKITLYRFPHVYLGRPWPTMPTFYTYYVLLNEDAYGGQDAVYETGGSGYKPVGYVADGGVETKTKPRNQIDERVYDVEVKNLPLNHRIFKTLLQPDNYRGRTDEYDYDEDKKKMVLYLKKEIIETEENGLIPVFQSNREFTWAAPIIAPWNTKNIRERFRLMKEWDSTEKKYKWLSGELKKLDDNNIGEYLGRFVSVTGTFVDMPHPTLMREPTAEELRLEGL